MSKNNRGNKPRNYERNSRKAYEWGSPTLRLCGDLCLLGAILVMVAVAFTYKIQGVAVRVFSGCFLFFGLSEILRSVDNRAKGGDKTTTKAYLLLGSAIIAAGIAFFFLVALKQPLAS